MDILVAFSRFPQAEGASVDVLGRKQSFAIQEEASRLAGMSTGWLLPAARSGGVGAARLL
jgi:hypothetical protein